eukprot:1158905-Pelagomonas_calceolata.AAC.4
MDKDSMDSMDSIFKHGRACACKPKQRETHPQTHTYTYSQEITPRALLCARWPSQHLPWRLCHHALTALPGPAGLSVATMAECVRLRGLQRGAALAAAVALTAAAAGKPSP